MYYIKTCAGVNIDPMGQTQSKCREGSTMPVSLHTKKEFPAQNSFSKGRNLLDDVTAGFF